MPSNTVARRVTPALFFSPPSDEGSCGRTFPRQRRMPDSSFGYGVIALLFIRRSNVMGCIAAFFALDVNGRRVRRVAVNRYWI